MQDTGPDWSMLFQCHIPVTKRLFTYLSPANVLSFMYAFPFSTTLFPSAVEYDVSRFVKRALCNLRLSEDLVEYMMEKFKSGEWALTGDVLLMALYDVVWVYIDDMDIIYMEGIENNNVENDPFMQMHIPLEHGHFYHPPLCKCMDMGAMCANRQGAHFLRSNLHTVTFTCVHRLTYGVQGGDSMVINFLYPQQHVVPQFVARNFAFPFCHNVFTKGKLTIAHPWSVAWREAPTECTLEDHLDYLFQSAKEQGFWRKCVMEGMYQNFLRYRKRGFYFRLQMYYLDTGDEEDEEQKKWMPTSLPVRGWDQGRDDYRSYVSGDWNRFWLDRIDERGELLEISRKRLKRK